MRTANSRLPAAQQPEQNEEGEQHEQKGGESKKKQGKKQRKKISLAIKAQNFETSKGLKQLYELTKQIRWEDPMTTDSAMNLVVMTLKSWHYQFKPKYSTDYFLKRCQVVGSDKQVLSYLHKVRRIHKGLDQWQQSKPNNPNPTSSNKPNQEGVVLQQQGLPYENYDESPAQQIPRNKNTFNQRAEIAKRLAQTTQKNNMHQSQQQNEMDQMMDEDLRMFQEMNRNKYQAGNKEKRGKNQIEHENDEDEGMELGAESQLGAGYSEYYDD